MIFGVVSAVVFDIDCMINALFGLKFAADFIMMCVFAFAFFLVLIAYADGELRGWYILSCTLGFALYYFIIHKTIGVKFIACASKLHNRLKLLSKKLKFGKKSFKKLLHLHK